MKELSIEQKAKAYDEALERARTWKDKGGMPKYKQGILDDIFPELKESEDERIRKAIVATIHLYYGESLEDEAKEMIDWLEKQGEQNPANKVEPKFKVGDWIVNNTTLNLCHIVKVEHGQYICDDCSFPITKENEYHLWTIQDAKDGDVLVTWNNTTFIFKAIEDDVVKYYIAYNEKWDEEIRVPLSNDSHVGLAESQFEFKPATKEQRDTLMKAMTDAGYTFDFEKKRLKKIEQESTDEDMKEALRTEYEKGRADVIAEMQSPVDCIDCTNSKGCINCKDGNMKETLVQKPAWTEEDKGWTLTRVWQVDHKLVVAKTIEDAITLFKTYMGEDFTREPRNVRAIGSNNYLVDYDALIKGE